MRPSRLLVSALLLSAAPAAAAEAVTYAGTVGGAEIVLELAFAPDGAVLVGRYAELAKAVDVPLHAAGGAGGDEAVRLKEEKPCTVAECGDPQEGGETRPAFGAEWALERDGENVTLTGARRDLAGGEDRPVALTRVGSRTVDDEPDSPLVSLDPLYMLYTPASPSLTRENFPYDFRKMDVPRKPGEALKVGAGEVRMDEDPRTMLAYPVVTALAGADLNVVNDGLLAMRLRNALSSFTCMSAVYHGAGWLNEEPQGLTGFEDGGQTVTVDHLSARLLSLTETGSFWCGGAHPSHVLEHHLLDTRTGEPIVAEWLLSGWRSLGRDGTPVDPETYDNADYSLTQGPTDELAAFVRERRKRFDAEVEESCFYDELVASNLALAVKGENLVFTLQELPHAIFACTEDLLTVPIKDARPLLTEKGAGYFAALDR